MENKVTYGDVPTVSASEPANKSPASPTTQSVHVEVDDSKANAQYANFCRLVGTPEEVLFDFGLNLQPAGVATNDMIRLPQRVVLGWYTAKRLLHALQQSIDRHEAAFGALETDVQKRVRRN